MKNKKLSEVKIKNLKGYYLKDIFKLMDKEERVDFVKWLKGEDIYIYNNKTTIDKDTFKRYEDITQEK